MHKIFVSSIKTVALSVFTVLLVSAFPGCKSDSNPTGVDNNGGGTNSISLNGDGWSNSTLTVSASTSTYGISENATVISIGCSDGTSIILFFMGNQKGTFNFNDPNSDTSIGMTMTSGTGQDVKYYTSTQNSGSVTISNYGAVGSVVSGSFSGKIYNAVTQAEASISGSFSAIRTVDAP